MIDRQCTIIVNSCDDYEDTWYPFFKMFSVNWPDCEYPIVLNTETKGYDYPNLSIKCFRLFTEKKVVSWSRRLIDTLMRIDSEYIIMLMDDFFLTDTVDTEEIRFIKNQMNKDSLIGVCYLSPMNPIHCTEDKEIIFGGHTGYSERAKLANKWTFVRDFFKPYLNKDLRGLCLVNAQAAIWRKEFLFKTLSPSENAWEWEGFGTLRAYRFEERFVSVLPSHKAIVPYDFNKGTGIIQGVWVPDVVEPLFKKYDISIDLSIRGVKTKDWNYKHNKEWYKKLKSVLRVLRNLMH